MPTQTNQTLTAKQVLQITKAMLSVASVDTIQPAEAALIGQFYETSRSPDMPTTANLLADPTARTFVAADFSGCSDEFADTVVLMCLMTAHADGKLSANELAHVQSIAAAVGVEAARFDAHLEQVRDELVGALSHLPDSASVAAIARDLTQVR